MPHPPPEIALNLALVCLALLGGCAVGLIAGCVSIVIWKRKE